MSRHKGIRTLMLDTLDKQSERDTRHRKDAARIAELEGLLANSRAGFAALSKHHAELADELERKHEEALRNLGLFAAAVHLAGGSLVLTDPILQVVGGMVLKVEDHEETGGLLYTVHDDEPRTA